MKKRTLLPGLVLCVSFAHAPAFALADERLIVTGANAPTLKTLAEREGGAIEQDLEYETGFVVTFAGDTAGRFKAFAAPEVELERDIEISLPEPLQTSGRSRRGVLEQRVPWGIHAVRADSAWAASRGEGVTVCVVDSGVDRDHPDLRENVIGGENLVASRGRVDRTDWGDSQGHGTHVAGIIAAADNGIGVVGVAPSAKIFAAKVFGRRGTAHISTIAEGVRSCLRHGAQVINMSLGGADDSRILSRAIRQALRQGVIVVAAAGNDGKKDNVDFPGRLPGVIAVGAVDENFELAKFSDRGPEVGFVAPGVDVLSTVPDGGYASFNGTSMAVPHVSGVAALAVAAGKSKLQGRRVGLAREEQGAGLIDATRTLLRELVSW